MKRLWGASALLVALFCLTLWNVRVLAGFTGALTQNLRAAQTQAEAQNWRGAQEQTQAAYDLWTRHTGYVHVTLRHTDADAVTVSFREVTELLAHGERGTYAAANARLIAQIELLCEAEALNLKNVL